MEKLMGDEERAFVEETVAKYAPEVDKLAAFLPWLDEKYGQEVKKNFDNPDILAGSVSFPVYDSNLMQFINVAEGTIFMDPNYVYTFSRHRLRTVEEEENFIRHCEGLKDLKELGDIVAKYVLGGRTKARLWSEGVKNGILLSAVTKMQSILEKYR